MSRIIRVCLSDSTVWIADVAEIREALGLGFQS